MQKTLKIAETHNARRPNEAAVRTFDVQTAHIRGRKQKNAEVDPTLNAFQPDMSDAIKKYTSGKISVGKFKEQLSYGEVKVDPKLETLIRKHEAGDSVTYNEFGKHIFR